MKPTIWLTVTGLLSVVGPTASQETAEILEREVSGPKVHRFKFKTRNVGGRKVAVLSPRMDPERGRRSILVADGEGLLLHPDPFSHRSHQSNFLLPPFEDEDQFRLNSSSSRRGGVPWKKETRAELMGSSYRRRLSSEGPPGVGEIPGKVEVEFLRRGRSGSPREGGTAASERKRRRRTRRKKRNKKKRKKQKKNDGDNKQRKKNRKSKQRKKIIGEEACQYKILKKCGKNLGLFPKRKVENNLDDYEKCDQRKEFLACVEHRRNRKPCSERTVARGDLSRLRKWMKKVFWTSSSCLLNESIRGI